MSDFQGINDAAILPTRLTEIAFARKGVLFTSTTDAGIIGLREDATLNKKSSPRKDTADRPMTNSYDIDIQAKALETTLPRLRAYYLLGKELHQLRVTGQSGDNYYFNENTGTFAAPNGSRWVGMEWKFQCDTDNRDVELNWHTRLHRNELIYIATNATTAHPGQTGGTTGVDFGGLSYDRTANVPSNWESIVINGNAVGAFESAKLELSSKGRKDMRGRVRGQSIDVKGEISLIQTSTTEWLAALDAANNDWTIDFNSWNDEIFRFTSGAVGLSIETKIGDKENTIKLMFEGNIPNNTDETTPNSFDCGVTTANICACTLVGYSA